MIAKPDCTDVRTHCQRSPVFIKTTSGIIPFVLRKGIVNRVGLVLERVNIHGLAMISDPECNACPPAHPIIGGIREHVPNEWIGLSYFDLGLINWTLTLSGYGHAYPRLE